MKRLAWFLLFALPAMAQVIPYRSPRVTFQDSVGNPLSGGCIFTYQGGTTTPQATYTDFTGGTPNANPVVLDVTGSAVMWLGVNTYKFKAYSAGGVNCSSGSLQWTVDQVPGDAFLNGTISGALITSSTIQNGTQSGTTISGVTIGTSAINSTTIGQTIPAAGAFTSLAQAAQIVNFSVSPTFNASNYGVFFIQLSGNVTSSTLAGGQIGQQVILQVCENATGGYTFVWPTNLLNPPVINPAPNVCSFDVAFYDQTISRWQTIAYYTGSAFPVLAHAIVMADLSNTVYGNSALVNLFNSPVAGTIPIAGTATYNGIVTTSKCTLTTAAAASTTFSLKDGASVVGTIAFAASGTTGAINIVSAFPVSSGDSITIVGPGTADVSAAGLNCSLAFGY